MLQTFEKKQNTFWGRTATAEPKGIFLYNKFKIFKIMIYKINGSGGNSLEAQLFEDDKSCAELKIQVCPNLSKEFKIPKQHQSITVYLDDDDIYNLIGALHSLKAKLKKM